MRQREKERIKGKCDRGQEKIKGPKSLNLFYFTKKMINAICFHARIHAESMSGYICHILVKRL